VDVFGHGVIRRRGITYPSEQVLVQIEFASSRAQLLNLLDDLNPVSDVLNYRSQIPDSYLDCLGNNLSNNHSQPLSVSSQGWESSGVIGHLWATVVARKNNNVVFRHGCKTCPTEFVVCDEARE
jgi:hypothetical protein